MDKISELRRILGKTFPWHKARVDCFAQLLLALIMTRTVNLSELALAMPSRAEVASRYKRLQRFFASFRFDYDQIARFIFNSFFQGKKIYLTIDRTNWFWGKFKINLLVLAIAYEGVAIPICWCLLNKAGNATAIEHRAIIQRFIRLFGKTHIVGILADREFASATLFEFCNTQRLPFYIRVKEDSIIRFQQKKHLVAKRVFMHLKPNQRDTFPMSVWLYGQKVYLAGSRSERGELMIVATNERPNNAIALYLRRWEIECLFACLKGLGFRFEQTHLVHRDRIKKLMALLAMGFCWAHQTGEWRDTQKPIRWSNHRYSSKRPQHSYFRYGLDYLRELVINPWRQTVDFIASLAFLDPPTLLSGESS